MARHRLSTGRRTWLLAAAGALLAGVLAVASADGFDPDSDFARAHFTVLSSVAPGSGAIVVDVRRTPVGRPIQPGFVGLSLEYSTVERYAGTDPAALDPVLVQLIRDLAPGQRPVLRIGGDTTDWTWWPARSLPKPLGIRISIGPRFGAVLRSLALATDARLILGIDLEADSRRLAGFEAAQLIHAVGRSSLLALELGNEPELYGSWPWRITASGRRIIGRAAGYGVPAYLRDFGAVASALPPAPLAGPALGGPRWISHVGQFIDAESRIAAVTVHAYPLQACETPLVAPTYPTVTHLLAQTASRGLANRLAAAVRTAHGNGLPLRVDEMNSVSCGGAPGVSDTFASALWALDTMFELARVGVDGINIHTFQIAKYRLFRMRRRRDHWQGQVAPEYYGLILFARAAPAGSRLLRVSSAGGSVRAWATRSPDGVIRTVLINDSPTASRVVEVHDPTRVGLAAYEALRAPGLGAKNGVSLGGAGFGAVTDTGILASPRRIFVRPSHGAYVVRLAPASAVMLTVPAHAGGAPVIGTEPPTRG